MTSEKPSLFFLSSFENINKMSDKKIFVESSVFLSYLLKDKFAKSSYKKLKEWKYNAEKKEYMLVTSHEVLGEIFSSILESRGDIPKAINEFYRCYSSELYKLATPSPKQYSETLVKVKEKDSNISPTDSKIIANALAEECNEIYTTEEDWSQRIEKLGIKIKKIQGCG